MSIIKWDPYKNAKQLKDSIDGMFDSSLVKSKHTEDETIHSEWVPNADIFEDEVGIIIKVDLPGVAEKDVSIKYDNTILILKGTRQFKPETSVENYRRIERPYGTFLRKFAVPSNIDENNIKAEFNEGILRLTLPKKK